MKWMGLILTLAAVLPLAVWLRRNPRGALKIWMVMGFLPFVLIPFHLRMAIISWTQWPGILQGAEFSVIDSVALAFLLTTGRMPRPLPFRFSMTFYFLAVLLAAVQAHVNAPSLFYPWQLARMFLVYVAVAKGTSSDPRVAMAIIKGMAAGLITEAGVGLWQRFGLGILQVEGTFDAQKSSRADLAFRCFSVFCPAAERLTRPVVGRDCARGHYY